ncbi:MAG: hypothetical protein M3P18_01755 [Actinomycetota bacterium]|nr:hypothetical protein [Actinomycetota bacterium]
MAITATPPPGVDFLFEAAVRALDDQMRWIDALDTKAGVLLAADGVIAGLVLTRGSMLLGAPAWVGVLVAFLLFISLVLALLSFSTRRFELAPDLSALVPAARTSSGPSLRWAALPDILSALEINEPKIGQKANLLFYSGAGLMVAAGLFGGYFLSQLIK